MPDSSLTWAMQTVNSADAREFNSRHCRRGHLFGARFADRLVDSDAHTRRTIAYVLENPVRAGIVRKPHDWPWSGLEALRPRDEVDAPLARSRNLPVRLAG